MRLLNPNLPRLPLRVLLASPRGFCAGVERAIAVVETALEQQGAPIYVRHEIVHNRHVVQRLEAMGAVFVEELSQVPDGATTVFSAHGVASAVEEDARQRGLPVHDATCPLVTKVHLHGARLAREGRHVVLIGHAGHAEVDGTLGRITAPVHLVASPEDVAALPLPATARVGYITQTTLSVDDTREIIAALHARFDDCAGPDVADICYATQNRQAAVRQLAARAQALVVVGAPYSSNTTRLREIGESLGKPTWQIEEAGQFQPEWLEGITTLGITAGASAPEHLVRELVTQLGEMRAISVSELDGISENVSFSLPTTLRQAPRAGRAMAGGA